MAEQLRRDYTLNYPIEQVKSSIEKVCSVKPGKYQLKNKNEAFNSYSIVLVTGIMLMLPMNIQLRKVSEHETSIDFSVTLGETSQTAPLVVNQALDNFFELVGKVLLGENIGNPANTGCMLILCFAFVIIALGFSLSHFI